MKSRSGIEISLPAIILGTACLISVPTLMLALLWLFVGAACIGHRDLETFPTDGVPRRWRTGARGWILWIYHIAWWPWYMRAEISQLLLAVKARLSKHSRRAESEDAPDDKSESH
ncbi:hypothetical protein AWB71_02832 [Caballeronia peredens]|nr:hypothetical protein AWB71_02832 [Caballeronia peredens]